MGSHTPPNVPARSRTALLGAYPASSLSPTADRCSSTCRCRRSCDRASTVNCQEEPTPMRTTDRSRARLSNGRARPKRKRCAERRPFTGRHGPTRSPCSTQSPSRHPERRVVESSLSPIAALLALLGSCVSSAVSALLSPDVLRAYLDCGSRPSFHPLPACASRVCLRPIALFFRGRAAAGFLIACRNTSTTGFASLVCSATTRAVSP